MLRKLNTFLMPIARSAATEGAPAAEAPVKVERVKQNGVTKPAAGSKTGAVWDIADKISAEKQRPALREEVMEAGKAAGLNNGTIATQYARWTEFHGVTKEQRQAVRDSEKPAPEAQPADPAETE